MNPRGRAMVARRTVLLSAAIVTALGLAACHKKDEAPTADPKAVAAAQAAIAAPAWMRQHLPAQTVAYLRIPSPWAMIGGVPNGRPLDTALSSKAHLDAVQRIRDGMAKDKVLADMKIAPLVNLLLSDLRSPVEVALVDPLGIPAPTSRLVLTALLDYPSVDAFNARMAALDKPVLAAPLDAQGDGQLTSGGAVRYVAAEHRLWVTQSAQAPSDKATLDELAATFAKSTAATAPATLSALEPRIDTSGEGLFGWVTVRGVGGVAAAQAGDSPFGKLPADFASKADAVAFGGGTVDGRAQFRVIVHAPQARALSYLAPHSFAPTLKSAGEPHWAMTLSLPTAQAYKTFEDNLNLDFGADAAKKYHEGIEKMRTRYGATPADWFRWFGPEMIVFSDDAGLFYAMRTPDRKDWYARIDAMSAKGWKTGESSVDGTKVHWLSMPGPGMDDEDIAHVDPSIRPFMSFLSRLGGRSYWIEDGDWVVMAKVPQALSDRVAAKPDTSLDDWFKARAYPGGRTLIGYTATSHGAQREAYYSYIQILQLLGTAVGADLDITTLPSAHTLNLPDKGVMGAAVEADNDTFGVAFTYEQSPVELVGEVGGMGAVAGVAIVAAIAVPQYQEYTLRSQVSSALGAADAAKAAVAERRQTSGKFPATNRAAGLGAPETLGNDYAGAVEVGPGGEIVVTMDATPPHKTDAKLDGATLVLTPRVEGNGVAWSCSGEGVEPKYLPATCRDEPLVP
ncbi:Tfp pilus assembly protein PilE [Luteibacter sp. UNCMF366Tsu5.1]|nr:Tfp pilus assembly protein PilE [Luteibacter sp. UNCMF366Tsu5.1]